jgi:hypothetical protein
MNVADLMVLLLLAVADIGLIVHLRRRRARRIRADRMMRSLQLHIRSVLVPEAVVAPPGRRPLRLAS